MDSWDYEECLDLIDYIPQRNNFFDIWQYEGTAEQDIQEGELDDENLDEYLSRAPEITLNRRPIGGLRLIYSCIGPQLDCNDSTVFWSRSDFMKIVQSFRLPKRFTQAMARCHCFFAQSPPEKIDAEAEHFSYVFSTLFHHCPFWALAAFWDSEKNITYAFLQCDPGSNRDSIPRLKRFLAKSAPQALHPLLVPVLIMDLETNLTLRDDERWTAEIRNVESETGQEPDCRAKTLDPFDLDLPGIVQRLNGCSVFLSLIERESEVVLLHLDQALNMISDLQSMSPNLRKSSNQLTGHVNFLISSRKNLFLRLQNLQRRSQT
ncbi:hypothetical protein BKA61DRAFT_285199 [Leptodontidium sp. MPI-SDFR-AT-0119]|nr:hypothetical protein BKA61DRAFT_285199 [Leptodontidium sp. MPI-SDFR-AT-0119]